MQAGVKLDVPTRDEWQRVWEACEYATFFQSPAWASIWEATSEGSIRPQPQRLTFPDGRQAILPLCHERRGLGLLSRRVASPHGTFGGWISEHPLEPAHARVLLGLLLDPGASLVWRMNPYDPLALAAGAELGLRCKPDVTHALELSPGPEALLQRFRNGYKNDIRRARRSGRIHVEPATTLDDWRAYFRVYQDTLSRWGLSPEQGYPWRLFEVMSGLGDPNLTLWVARIDGAVVSGELCMYARRHAVSWHAATLASQLRSNVAKVQIYHVIEDAHRRGCRWFDFNPSAGLHGVREFKESFAAEALPAPLVYVDDLPKRWARKVASRLAVPYAALELAPLASVLASSVTARADESPPASRERARRDPASGAGAPRRSPATSPPPESVRSSRASTELSLPGD